jgi:protein gp37
MGATTNISWTDHTFNPWIGCMKVSPGCAHCYAETMDRNRFSRQLDGGTPEKPVSHWGKGAPRHRTSEANWRAPLAWNRGAAAWDASVDPAAQHRPRVFCASLADWLDTEVPAEWLGELLELIHTTPNLDWQLLTKRPEWWEERMKAALGLGDIGALVAHDWLEGRPPANVWLGVSVEDQERADQRIPELLKIPAKVRFLSIEPLLESVAIYELLDDQCDGGNVLGSAIDWVIVGGESGPARRDCGVVAIAGVVAQCQAYGVPVFVKQDCAPKPGQQGRLSDEVFNLKEFPR